MVLGEDYNKRKVMVSLCHLFKVGIFPMDSFNVPRAQKAVLVETRNYFDICLPC